MSNIVAIDNFTVTSEEFVIPGGDLISSVAPQAILTITPNQGYEIEASNFTVVSSNPEVDVPGSYFTQDGDNVILTVVFIITATMPNNNLDIKICMRGAAQELGVTIAGIINYDLLNAEARPSSTTYFNSGPAESTEEILSQIIEADSGYYFQSTPTISLNTGNPANYNLFTSNNVLTDNRLTSIRVNADYTYPFANDSDDIIDIYAHAIIIPVVSPLITGYSVNSSPFSYLPINRAFSIFGGAGAAYEVELNNGATFLSSGTNTITGVMGSGQFTDTIQFPTITADTTHTLTFSPTGSDLDPDVTPTSYWTVDFVRTQIANIELSGVVTTSDTDFTITNDGPTVWAPASTNLQNSTIEFEISVSPLIGYTIDWTTTLSLGPASFTKNEADGSFNVITGRKLSGKSGPYSLVLEVDCTTSNTGLSDMDYTTLIDIESEITKEYTCATYDFINSVGATDALYAYVACDGGFVNLTVPAGQDVLGRCARIVPPPSLVSGGGAPPALSPTNNCP